MTDTERLDWLETEAFGFALVSDDNGRFACVFDGFQTCPLGDSGEPETVQASFFVEKERWRDTIREAIDNAMEGKP